MFVTCMVGLCAVTFPYIFWLVLLDPLRHVPGPWYARVSSVWLAIQCRRGRRSLAVHKLHRQYGDVVRITVNHVSIRKADALDTIYGHDAIFPKGSWYDEFRLPQPPIIGVIDKHAHSQLRKDLTPAFSPQSLRDFEDHMSETLLRLKRRLLGNLDICSEASLDLNKWINLLAFDIVAEFAFGKPFGFLERGYDFLELMDAMNGRLNCANALGVLPVWIKPYMKYIPFDTFWRASATSLIKIRSLVETCYNERIVSGDMERKDLMSYMLSAKSEGGDALPKGQPSPSPRLWLSLAATVLRHPLYM